MSTLPVTKNESIKCNAFFSFSAFLSAQFFIGFGGGSMLGSLGVWVQEFSTSSKRYIVAIMFSIGGALGTFGPLICVLILFQMN